MLACKKSIVDENVVKKETSAPSNERNTSHIKMNFSNTIASARPTTRRIFISPESLMRGMDNASRLRHSLAMCKPPSFPKAAYGHPEKREAYV